MTKLIADSSCDLTKMEDVAFEAVPLTITVGETSFRDDENLDVPAFIDAYLNYKGRTFTACPGVNDWLSAFEGADTIFVGVLTSGISGAYGSAMAAREQYLEAHPAAKVHVFDTLTTGPELTLLMEKLADFVREGLSFEEICARGTEYLKRTRLFFSLQSLHNFAQNGRVSKVVAAATGLLSIRIVGTASPAGTLEPLAKPRGDARALGELIDLILKAGYRGGKILISHVQNPALAERFTALIRAHFPDANIRTYAARGLCSYYAEKGGLLLGVEI